MAALADDAARSAARLDALSGTIQPNLAQDDDDPNLRFSSDTGARLTDSKVFRLGTEFETGRFSGRIEASTSRSDSRNPNLSTTLNFINPNVPTDGTSNDNPVPFRYDLTGGALTFGIDFDSPFAPTIDQLLDPANVVLDAVTVGNNRTKNKEDAFRLDGSLDLDGLTGFFTSFDAGYRFNRSSTEFDLVRSTFGTGAIDSSPSGLAFSELLVPGPDNFGEFDGRELAFRNFLLIDPDRPWAIWYPLRRKPAFYQLEPRERGMILAEHGMLGRSYGEAGLAQDIRLKCFGLDRNDNEFLIGLVGSELNALSRLVEDMRETQQTAQHLDSLGPFFVGHRIGSVNIET